MADAQLQSSQHSLDQLVIEEKPRDWETEYLKVEQELENVNAMSNKLTKWNIDLSYENFNLKERNKELETDNEDGPRQHMRKGKKKRRTWLTIIRKLRYVYLTVYDPL